MEGRPDQSSQGIGALFQKGNNTSELKFVINGDLVDTTHEIDLLPPSGDLPLNIFVVCCLFACLCPCALSRSLALSLFVHHSHSPRPQTSEACTLDALLVWHAL